MNKFLYKTPAGTKDLLFEECEIHDRIMQVLSGLYASRGYHQVITPALENFDLFSLSSAGLTQEEMYKLVSPTGHLLVMRPDSTMPIARLVATRLKDAPLPLRLCYIQKVFRVNGDYKGRSNEVTQAGIELIGTDSLAADLEIIHTAAKSLEACGIGDYKIEVGHAGIFKALVAQLPVEDATREEIRVAIESKSYAALEDLLDAMEKTPVVRALKHLPRLFGGREVLEEARALFQGVASQELDYLQTLFDALEPTLSEKISLDLGLVHRNNYYTGVVFRGYATGSGDAVCSGGRYDTLFGEFGMDLPAVGFAADLDVMTDILLTAGAPVPAATPLHLVYAKPGFEMAALEFADARIAAGTSCEMMDYVNYSHAKEDAAERGACAVHLVGNSVETWNL